MELHKKRRIVYFTVILVICTACIGITISMQINKYYENEFKKQQSTDLYDIDQELFRSKFINSFNSKIIGEYEGIKKIEDNKDVIYSNITIEKVENKYDLNTNIPFINIDNEDVKDYNEKIKNLFENKILQIKSGNINTIYTVDYMANISNNILSIAIKATLKEGEKSQRLILTTFNYDLNKNEEIYLKKLINMRNLNQKDVQSKLKQEIEKQNMEALELQKLGYNVFIRNITEGMFNIKNITNYYMDTNGYIYIIYPYGNNNLTTEMDIVVF